MRDPPAEQAFKLRRHRVVVGKQEMVGAIDAVCNVAERSASSRDEAARRVQAIRTLASFRTRLY